MKARAMGEVSSIRQLSGVALNSSSAPPADDDKAVMPVRSRRGYTRQIPYLRREVDGGWCGVVWCGVVWCGVVKCVRMCH